MEKSIKKLKGKEPQKEKKDENKSISDLNSSSNQKDSEVQKDTEQKNSEKKIINEAPSLEHSNPEDFNNKKTSNSPVRKKKSPLVVFLYVMIAFLFITIILSIIASSRRVFLDGNAFFNNAQWGLSAAVHNSDWKDRKVVVEAYNLNFVQASFIYNGKLVYANFASKQDFVQMAAAANDPVGVIVDGAFKPNPNDNWSLYYEVYNPSILTTIIISWMPWIIFLGLSYFIMKKVIESQGQAGKMNKKSLLPQISNIKFENVEGYTEIKQELEEVVDFLKNPIKYKDVGARTPKGVLLSGPPGTGKTLFAKAIAGECSIPFYSISGSDFVEMFVGVGASRVRNLFSQAKKTAPSLIFIDELDAVGRTRGSGSGGGNDEREQTLNQLLVEMDGFVVNSGIIVVAATNRPDVLDPALKRPGRFDRIIDIRLPDVKEREAILKLHAKTGKKVFSSDVVWINIAMRTPGFSGAELENVINESTILSIRNNSKEITLEIIDESIDRVIGGPAKTNNSMSKEEKELISYHEAGHAIIGLVMDDAEKVQKISIVPRGQAGGYVLMTPKKEKIVQTKNELFSKITSYMGGRVSESVFFGENEVTTGAYSDIEEATKIARRMVVEFGMSSLGPIQFEKTASVYQNQAFGETKKYSDSIAFEIDKKVSELIDSAMKKATEIIKNNKEMIKLFAKALMIKEVLNSEDIEYIFKNKKLTKEILELEIKEKNSFKKPNSTVKKTPANKEKLNSTAKKTVEIKDKPNTTVKKTPSNKNKPNSTVKKTPSDKEDKK